MMKTAFRLMVLLALMWGMGAKAQEKVVSPKAGDPIRKTLFKTMRPAFEKDLQQKVIFQVDKLKVQRGWAFLVGTPLRPNGKPIDYNRTVYKEAIAQGAFGGGYCALLHKTNDRWKLVTYRIGMTDVPWESWDKQYHAPPAIFK
jgi:hypothetical protein